MKFKELEIENFLTVGNIDARLDNRGLVLVCGENRDDTSQDSNGAGKSSFVDALCWALFGVTARGVSGDDVINDTAAKNCRVKITLDVDGDEYVIARHRKYAKHRNRLHVFGPGGDDLTLGTDKLTQEVVDKLVGATVDVFCASIYAGQENMPDLPGMGDRELKSVVEEAAGIKDIEAGYREARDRLNSAKKVLDESNRELEFAHRRKAELESDLTDAQHKIDEWDKQHETRLKTAKVKVAEVKKRETVHTNQATRMRDSVAIQAQLDECDTKLSGLETERIELEGLRDAALNAEREVVSCNTAIEKEKKIAIRHKDQRAKVVEKLGTPCKECGRNHDDSTLGAAEESIKRDLKSTLLQIKQYQSDLVTHNAALESASESVTNFKSTMTDASDILTLQRDLRSELSEVTSHAATAEAIQAELKRAATDFVKVRNEENPYKASLTTVQERIEKNATDLTALGEKIKADEYAVNVATEVAGVFSPAGVRAHILDSVTPFLNDRTAHYLAALSDGNITAVWNTLGTTAKGEVREKFNIEVESMTGGNNFKKLSGGEKRKVRLSAAMALQDLVASRASKPIDLFIADEVDAALDESGLERLMGLLRDKADVVGSVLVISHSDLKSWISNSVTIVKEGGKASLSGVALCP